MITCDQLIGPTKHCDPSLILRFEDQKIEHSHFPKLKEIGNLTGFRQNLEVTVQLNRTPAGHEDTGTEIVLTMAGELEIRKAGFHLGGVKKPSGDRMVIVAPTLIDNEVVAVEFIDPLEIPANNRIGIQKQEVLEWRFEKRDYLRYPGSEAAIAKHLALDIRPIECRGQRQIPNNIWRFPTVVKKADPRLRHEMPNTRVTSDGIP